METPIKYKRIHLSITNMMEKENIIDSTFKEIISEGYKLHTYQEEYNDGTLCVIMICEKYNNKRIL